MFWETQPYTTENEALSSNNFANKFVFLKSNPELVIN